MLNKCDIEAAQQSNSFWKGKFRPRDFISLRVNIILDSAGKICLAQIAMMKNRPRQIDLAEVRTIQCGMGEMQGDLTEIF